MIQPLDFQLNDVLQILLKWKKQLIVFVLSSLMITVGIVFILPKKYLATTVCFPSNPLLADKSYIFNENIQNLYATYGSSPELDRLMSIGNLDTIYRFAINEFNLMERYDIADIDEEGFEKAKKEFKKHYNLEKTVFGEFKIHTWDKDPVRSATMANSIMNQISEMLAYQNNQFNTKILRALQDQRSEEKKQFFLISDSIRNGGILESEKDYLQIRKKGIAENISKYEKLINEFSIAVNAKAPSLQITEFATPQVKPDKPKKMRIIILSFLLSSFFAVLMVFILEQKKS